MIRTKTTLKRLDLSADLHAYLVVLHVEHRPMHHATHADLWWEGDTTLFVGNGVTREDLAPPRVEDEDRPVSAPVYCVIIRLGLNSTIVNPRAEALVRYV